VNRINVPEDLIEFFADSGLMRSLAFFARCKALYKNSTVYSYSPVKLASKLGYSPNMVRHHVRILESEGLIRRTAKNITFVKVSVRHKSTVIIEDQDTLKDITYKLYAKLLERNVDQQIWMSEKKAEVRKKHQVKTLKQLKRILRLEKDARFEKPHNPDITLSLSSISQLLGVSIRTAVSVRKFLEEKGYITLKTTTEKLGKMSFLTFLYSGEPVSYWYKGYAYKPKPSLITLVPYY